MIKKKGKTTKKYLIILVGIILIGITLVIPISNTQQDEIWFYSWLKKEEKEENTYTLDLTYENLDFRVIHLLDTVSPKMFMKETIAPGTQGEFNIKLKTKKPIKYQLLVNNLKSKPQNLVFQEKKTGKQVNQLKELEPVLAGKLEKEKNITYCIYWKWEYEINEEGNKQDTKDAKELKKYDFEIKAKVEEIIKE